jgi:hypothetical protein
MGMYLIDAENNNLKPLKKYQKSRKNATLFGTQK